MVDIGILKLKVLDGGQLTAEEAMTLESVTSEQYEELWTAAEEITRRFCKPVFDSCSIINARSGKCPENCKWCAQSAHYKTSADVYPMIDREECLYAADYNRRQGIRRFSLVTSGRALSGEDLDKACDYISEINRQGGIGLCASMGLLDRKALGKLYEAGVRRYHCNLETAPSYFPHLCSTHSIDDKIRTIDIAQELGMEICSGGIIGMGESRAQRIEFALTLRKVAPASIPINLLHPIPGTPLENTPSLSPEEILCAIAFFRFIHPGTTLRFAGGRASLSRDIQLRALRIGMNGGIVGDLLTTIGSKVADDKTLVAQVGYSF